ncbi:hypothetical protein HDU67_004278 [Dinochytrium kinnereticum]|nr:hypothetical protein HDU67_004278 [Dinochytrium kinnereticum]
MPQPLLPSLIHAAALNAPSQTAILHIDPRRQGRDADPFTLSYADVWARATLWAAIVSRRATNAGEGGERIRTAIIPLDRTDPRLHYILDDTLPSLIIAIDSSDTNILNDAISRFDQSSEGQERAAIVRSAPVLTLKELLEEAKSTGGDYGQFVEGKYGSDDVSHIYFTSGSTGRPKGCISTLGSLTAYVHAKNITHSITQTSTVFVASSHTFDPSLGDFVATLAAGATIALSPRSAILDSLAECINLTKSTHLLSTPALVGTIVDPTRCSTLEVLALGGELMGESIVAGWSRRVKLMNTYGVTECCVYQTAAVVSPNDSGSRKPGVGSRRDVGTAMGDNLIHIMTLPNKPESGDGIVDSGPQDLVPASNGEVGEIWISGPQVGLGYLNRPDLTQTRFICHPEFGRCFRTGDLARRVGDGKGLVYLGRHDTQIKVSGRRVEVEEVEQVILGVLAPRVVTEVAVVLNSAARVLVAYCVPVDRKKLGMDVDAEVIGQTEKKNREITVSLMRLVAERNLPHYMVPARFEFLSELPQTATGKIGRSALSKLDLLFDDDGDDMEVDMDDTLAPWITVIADAWRECLAIPEDGFRITPSMRFDEIGGDSIKALLVTRRLSRIIGVGSSDADVRDGNSSSERQKDFKLFVNGDLEPAELLKRPRLIDYARYLRDEIAVRGDDKTVVSGVREADISHSGSDKGFIRDLRSILYRAAGAGLLPVIRSIVTDLKVMDADGRLSSVKSIGDTTTPLHCACLNGHTETVRELIALGASLTARDARGVTPLHFAAHQGPVELLETVLANLKGGRLGDPLLVTDEDGQTPLHHAARSGAPPTVMEKLLHHPLPTIKPKPTVDDATLHRRLECRDAGSRTPLLWAAMNGHRGCVKVLMENGADVSARDCEGEDAVLIAERLARCGAGERGGGVRSSVFGDIARIVGGRGTTKSVGRFVGK